MRKFVLLLLIVIAVAVVWIWRGRDLAALSEKFGTIELRSDPVKSLGYQGNGKGGTLQLNGLSLELTPAKSTEAVPEVGTSKDGQVALSYAGKIFNFGKPTGSDEKLQTQPASDDQASIETRHSFVTWPNPFEMNFMTGNSPKWKRFWYRRLTWQKPTGAKLEMTWRCEQFYYANNGWSDACMTDPGFTGLVRIQISNQLQ